jgi:hypothetical protein
MQDKIDGILYPSVANIYENKNIVLTPEAVKTKLKFIQAEHYGVVHNSQNGGTVNFLPFRTRRYPRQRGKYYLGPHGVTSKMFGRRLINCAVKYLPLYSAFGKKIYPRLQTTHEELLAK